MIKISVKDLNLYYGKFHALKDINMDINKNEITAFIGPSGCGKSSFLRTLNRMNDLVEDCNIEGEILLDDKNIIKDISDVNILRKRVGMVFQKPNPFPMSIYDNIAYGPRTHNINKKGILDDIVEESLKKAAIWDEVKDDLKKSALRLSGGQMQRICIARALAVKPEVILLDEPTSALDPISTSKIEDLLGDLKKEYTIIMVTHNMQQATRISDKTAFFLSGELIEFNDTNTLFSIPSKEYRRLYNWKIWIMKREVLKMRAKFDMELDLLNDKLLEMGGQVESAIEHAVKALVNKDLNLANEVFTSDDIADSMEKDIEDMCLRIILRQHPVASDLRLISSILKMITDLERIGDQAQDISQITMHLVDKDYIKDLKHIKEMSQIVTGMVKESIDAFLIKDTELIKEVIEKDKKVNDLFYIIRRELIDLIRKDIENSTQAIDFLMIAKYLERIGNHAKNIAEWALFSITGVHKENM